MDRYVGRVQSFTIDGDTIYQGVVYDITVLRGRSGDMAQDYGFVEFLPHRSDSARAHAMLGRRLSELNADAVPTQFINPVWGGDVPAS